jgi:ribonucleotide reductase beta subunit family protein with ferritin-like domain
VADRLLVSLGNEQDLQRHQPLRLHGDDLLQGKTNFFEKRVGEYQKAGVIHIHRLKIP